MGLRDIGLDHSYTGKGDKILNAFLLPSLNVSKYYDRITGFYSLESLLAISQGVESIYNVGGRMRLIIGIHSFPREFVEATVRLDYITDQINRVRDDLINKISTLENSLSKKRIATLAWMIQDGLLEVKAAAVKQSEDSLEIFHPKTLLITDESGDTVAAIGSPNESRNGLGGNFEQLVVLMSWEHQKDVEKQREFFSLLWENKDPDAIVYDVSKDTAALIMTALGPEYLNPSLKKVREGKGIISNLSKMPTNYFVSGEIPALYMHQERAVIDALSRWPVRVLFADEVGLGKTFEAAATLVYLIKHCGAERAIILTPKSVLQQWQDELHEHFGLDAWLYDSSSKSYVSPDGYTISMNGKNPIGKGSPDLILMSAQLARGTSANVDIFSNDDSILPDVLVVDEAHSARVSKDLSGKSKKTKMYKMLERINRKIPHLILATATPMQKDPEEYHAMLKLLGLPKVWEKKRLYHLSLALIAKQEIPDNSDAYSAASLINSTMKSMKPSTKYLDEKERKLLDDVLNVIQTKDQYDTGEFVINNWDVFRQLFIKLHPARLLTVRNTRRSLTNVGYKFPKRNLKEESILKSTPIQLFYEEVNQYISNECFSIEKVLYPDKKISIGFVRVNYQQRVASSLYSCHESLKRRREKAITIKNEIERLKKEDINWLKILDFQAIDDLDDDELLTSSDETFDTYTIPKNVDLDDLLRAVNIECSSLNSLIQYAEKLLQTVGDLKIKTSISLAKSCIDNDDIVLLFSRYTDTIDALLNEYNSGTDRVSYGIYTGSRSSIIQNGKEILCDKSTLRAKLFAHEIKLVFCSDAASEGLNLQAARVLINVDVPWTPARLEQRIGRIARLGQVADEVDVYNIWYPYSIEARMYHRIQRRLESSNLAIGEFPEVVANTIKMAVIDNTDTDNDGLKELMEIRNSYQTKALEELWAVQDDRVTVSDYFRKQLMNTCDSHFEYIDSSLNGRIRRYQMPDGSTVSLTSDSGMPESISLASKPWEYKDFYNPNLRLCFDVEGNPCAYSVNQKILKHERVIELAEGGILSDTALLKEYPNMLPDPTGLDLSVTVETMIKTPPRFWPPRKKESNES